MRRPRLPLGAQLLAAASLLLLLPWASLPFATWLRRSAVEAQQETLATTASRAAAVLSVHPRPFLPEDGAGTRAVRLLELAQPVIVDGDASDWADEAVEPMRLPEPDDDEPAPFSAVVRLGTRGAGVYALVEVRDPRVVLRDSATGAPGDRLEIAAVTADDEWLRFDVDAAADGPVAAWLVRGGAARLPDNRIEGAWRSAEGGYTVELRLPRTLVGSRLAIAVVDVEDQESRTTAARLETSGTESADAAAIVVAPAPADAALLDGLAGPATRLWVVNGGKHVVALSGTLAPPLRDTRRWPASWLVGALGPLSRSLGAEPPASGGGAAGAAAPRPLTSAVERALSGEPAGGRRTVGDTVVLSAAHPVRASGRVRGAVLMEQAARDALDGPLARRLTSLLALATAGAVLLLAFATVLSFRLRRLGGAVERLAEDSRSSPADLPEARAGDEIGDLARGLAGLASRQREHTAYLEQVGRRLSHEMRTPVGVVRTSLDNLRLTGVPDAARVYLERADGGVRRLSVILSRLSEATRLEQSLAATERETYDLVPVVRGCVEGHRASFPGREIALRAPDAPLLVSGSPELVAQLLDKLVDNALGFARPGTAIEVDVTGYGRAAALSVRNEGPLLPAEMEGRLFDSMVSIRKAAPVEAAPHLGLGLYIVRLVAEFHGGSAAAHDRPDGRGVIVTVTFPVVVTRAP